LIDYFKTDKVSFSYIFTNEEPHICKQFGITGAAAGAVLYKPKRNRYVKLEGIEQNAMMVEPSKIQ
jgi:hypothetical protein